MPAQTDQDFDPGNRAVLLVEIRRALLEVVSNLVALIRRIDDPRIPAIGEWTVGDVAAHLALAFAVDLRAISARPLNDVPLKDVPAVDVLAVDVPAVDVPAVDVPAVDVTVTPAGMAAFNRSSLLEQPNRDGKALAAEIEELARRFDAAAEHATGSVTWLGGVRLDATAVAGHALEECLMHGYDIALALGLPWPIQRRHAVLALEAGVFPLLSAVPKNAFIDEATARHRNVAVELRVRGGGRTVMAVRDGALHLGPPGPDSVDAYLSADPVALMLTFLGRRSVLAEVVKGRLVAWGRRPWKLPGLLAATTPP